MRDTPKFEYGLDYQEDLLSYAVLDRNGHLVVELFKDSYFALLEHAVIATAIKEFYNKNKRVPGKTILKEELYDMFKQREYIESLTGDDQKNVIKLVDTLFAKHLKDSDEIFNKCANFASFTEMKDQVENIDIYNVATYPEFAAKVQKAINLRTYKDTVKGTFLIKDIKDRQMKRQTESHIIPTPFRQINALTNAGGYAKNSIMLVLDRPKKLKTAMLVNLSRGYMKLKKKVLYIDLENGEEEIAIRIEQSLSKSTKQEILSGKEDKYIQKILRKYRRIGGEVVIRRLPAFSNAMDIQAVMDELYRDHGFQTQVLVIDYLGKMGSISRKQDDTERISDAYIDVANLAERNDIEHVWTAHHVVRDAEKRSKTKYKESDIAKCIDIVRHVHAIYGLNANEEELEEGIVRMELIVQRDGKPTGRGVFYVDAECQRIEEMKPAQRHEYDKMFSQTQMEIGDDE